MCTCMSTPAGSLMHCGSAGKGVRPKGAARLQAGHTGRNLLHMVSKPREEPGLRTSASSRER